MIIVTGGAGFIGSNIVAALGRAGRDEIAIVDDLRDGGKFLNLLDCDIADYWDKDDFLERVCTGRGLPGGVTAIVHQGACSDTMESDGRYMLRNNFEYSKHLLHHCLRTEIPFVYASSAAVYGGGTQFLEAPECERPLNVYGYSKLLFDQAVRRQLAGAGAQIVGLRYFNVYGPREQHKGRMASVAYHLNQQLVHGDVVELFVGSGGYGDGEQRRDFVHVDDVAAVVLWFLANPQVSGIFNVGTGRSQTFNDVASAAIAWHGRGRVEYVAFPDGLRARYQSFTEADIGALRAVGCEQAFRGVEAGVKDYLGAVQSER